MNVGKGYPIRKNWVLIGSLIAVLASGTVDRIQAASTERTLRSWVEVHQLTTEEARRRHPVRMQFVVTYSARGEHNLWAQDRTGVGFAFLPESAGPFPLGEELQIEGVTDPGDFGPCVRITSYRDLKNRGIPKAVEVPLSRVMSGSEDGRRILTGGRLVSVTLPRKGESRTRMVLALERTRLPVYLYGLPAQSISTLLDAEVRIIVTPALTFNSKRQFTGVTLNLARPEDLTVVVPGSRDVPVSKIQDLLTYRPGGIKASRVRVEGVATYYDGNTLLAIQDGSRAVFAQLAEPEAIPIGSWLSVFGYARARSSSPILTDARAFQHNKDVRVTPQTMTATEATSGRFDAQLVRLTGDIVDHGYSHENQAITVRSDGVTFVADFPKGAANYVAELQDNSTVQLTGILELQMGGVGSAPPTIRLLLRDGADIAVLNQPSWLTRTHLIYIAEVLGALLVCFLIWVTLLRRQVYRQTTRLWEQRRRAAQREENHRVLVENASDLIFTVLADGKFLSANHATAKVIGRASDVLSAMKLHDLIVPHERSQFESWFDDLMKTGDSAREFGISTESGLLRTVDLSAHVSSLTSNPEHLHVEFVGRDVTARKKTYAALEQARKAAETANAAKTRFLTNMSHEIRTPLNAILGTAELLSATELAPDQRAYVATFQNSGNALLQLLNGILDLTRVESGQLQLESIVFPVEATITSVVAMMSAASREKGIRINWKIDHDVPSYVIGDPTRIRQILTNLVGNAVKFTEVGGVRVEASVKPGRGMTKPGKMLLVFSVNDSGVGIPAEKLDLIFERFTQADGSTTRRFGGSGLGLSISKGLAEAMGGSIQVKSTLGEGSEFVLTVPVDMAQLNARDGEPTSDAPSSAELIEAWRKHPASILIAEDNEANRLVIEAYLKEFPLSIDWASNGVEAVELERQREYDLILMDIEMPEMDGYEAIRQISGRRIERGLPPITILALTAHAFEETRSEVERAGCSELLTKPIRRKVLLATMARHLEQRVEPKTH